MEEGMGLLAVSFWRRNYFGKKNERRVSKNRLAAVEYWC
jgi:hypothetical protein